MGRGLHVEVKDNNMMIIRKLMYLEPIYLSLFLSLPPYLSLSLSPSLPISLYPSLPLSLSPSLPISLSPSLSLHLSLSLPLSLSLSLHSNQSQGRDIHSCQVKKSVRQAHRSRYRFWDITSFMLDPFSLSYLAMPFSHVI